MWRKKVLYVHQQRVATALVPKASSALPPNTLFPQKTCVLEDQEPLTLPYCPGELGTVTGPLQTCDPTNMTRQPGFT